MNPEDIGVLFLGLIALIMAVKLLIVGDQRLALVAGLAALFAFGAAHYVILHRRRKTNENR